MKRQRVVLAVASAAVACALAAVLAGCGSGASSASDSGEAKGSRMAGAVRDVQVTREAIENTPSPWDLETPESAVRSYIDWVSYAWRIGQSQVATPTMTTYEEVRVDSYIQYNIQKERLIDQDLRSIEFGKPSETATSVVLPAQEDWTYRYVSIDQAGKTIGGPYEMSYDATYTVVEDASGAWQVDKVEAAPHGEVK